ncbi:hypothetical protein [Antarctobacter sp.]|uniref:hypothetical protein n=1 Tax=Antarctobacter sp. TaxID=1872577 RepID=UPI002B26C7E0|nr:hypothetical protein [Antarctobacter sp.]
MHSVDLHRVVARKIDPYLGTRMTPLAERIGAIEASYGLKQISDTDLMISDKN